MYRAVLPQQAFAQDAYPFGGNIKGEILATASPDGIGVLFKVRFSNLPKEGGPFRKFRARLQPLLEHLRKDKKQNQELTAIFLSIPHPRESRFR